MKISQFLFLCVMAFIVGVAFNLTCEGDDAQAQAPVPFDQIKHTHAPQVVGEAISIADFIDDHFDCAVPKLLARIEALEAKVAALDAQFGELNRVAIRSTGKAIPFEDIPRSFPAAMSGSVQTHTPIPEPSR